MRGRAQGWCDARQDDARAAAAQREVEDRRSFLRRPVGSYTSRVRAPPVSCPDNPGTLGRWTEGLSGKARLASESYPLQSGPILTPMVLLLEGKDAETHCVT